MKKLLTLITTLLITCQFIKAQPCTPLGDQTTYGANNTWIGYVYDNMGFTSYMGYVNEGNAVSPNFDESFGGDNVNYATNGCSVNTETFSVRYKLTKSFAFGSYQYLSVKSRRDRNPLQTNYTNTQMFPRHKGIIIIA